MDGVTIFQLRRKKTKPTLPKYVTGIRPDYKLTFESCMICLQNFKRDEDIYICNGCKKYNHAKCIDSWLVTGSRCPACRTKLKDDE